jgi:Zn-dependent protease
LSSADTYALAYGVIWVALFLLVSGPIHECAHAYAALKMGDGTAKLFGRITLDPITHFDPVGGGLLIISVVLNVVSHYPGVGFGWAKPTPVNPYNLRGKHADSIVAAAGPISNLILALVCAIAFRFMWSSGYSPTNDNFPDLVTLIFFIGVELNLFLMLFNFIPVAPLDGSHVLLDFVSPRTAMELRGYMNQYGIMLLLVVVLLAGRIIYPIMAPIGNFLIGVQGY